MRIKQYNITGVLSEAQEQLTVIDWLRRKGLIEYTHASPNGGKRNVIEARKLKALGCSAGFPDIMIFEQTQCKAGFYSPGVAIELKAKKGGHLTDNQEGWLRRLEEKGWAAYVCYGADEAIEALERHYGKL